VGNAERSTAAIQLLSFGAQVSGPPEIVDRLRASRQDGPRWALRRATNRPVAFTIETPPSGGYRLVRDDVCLYVGGRIADLLAHFDRALNGAAVEHLQKSHLLVHAGGVAYADQGLLLPAASGAGKTTLVAALLTAGFQYLTDEVAVLQPGTGRLLPFPKSLSITPGGRRALRPLYPDLASRVVRGRIDGETVWFLVPSSQAWPNAPVPVRHVVLPRYVPRAKTELIPLARTEALAALLAQMGPLAPHGASRFRCLVDMLTRADCHTLTVGALAPAVECLKGLLCVGEPATTGWPRSRQHGREDQLIDKHSAR